ncbi:MAG: hypothetical protein IJW39_03560 [Opitutales bacterium]|nr:hypothetical protein [Opitutales bacterium]
MFLYFRVPAFRDYSEIISFRLERCQKLEAKRIGVFVPLTAVEIGVFVAGGDFDFRLFDVFFKFGSVTVIVSSVFFAATPVVCVPAVSATATFVMSIAAAVNEYRLSCFFIIVPLMN